MDIIPEERIELGLPPFLYVGVDVFDSWGWGVICRKEEIRLTERDGHRGSRGNVNILINQRPSTIYSVRFHVF